MPISKDSKPNSVEEEKEKLITKPVNPLLSKIRINSTLLNTDLFQESLTRKLSAKLFMPHLKVTEL